MYKRQEFSRQTGFNLLYHGEAMPTVMHQAINLMLVRQRRWISAEDARHLMDMQNGSCAICDDELVKYEVDHRKLLCEGGNNDVSNLQLLCKGCHAEKTQMEELARATKFHTLESQLSEDLYNVFHLAPKPREVSGAWTAPSNDSSQVPGRL